MHDNPRRGRIRLSRVEGIRRLNQDEENSYREFVTAQLAPLRSLAFVACGNWHTAEDAVANTLARIYPRWRKLDRPELYAKKMVLRAVIDESRRPWRRERPASDALPDSQQRDPAGAVDEKLRMRTALLRVPARQRAVLVLRFYLDHSVEETAEILGCSTGTVKSHGARGLARLRDLLGAGDTASSGQLTSRRS
jgi:RNA polymerase sigma-70 factor (sigma-E family)